jgi:hypothetical protein
MTTASSSSNSKRLLTSGTIISSYPCGTKDIQEGEGEGEGEYHITQHHTALKPDQDRKVAPS